MDTQPNRWTIAFAGVIMQIALGAVYAWSVFRIPLTKAFGYGGGFGTMPAFAADYFGAENVGSIYGLMLTAWGFAGVLGPTLIARIRQGTGHYSQALHVIAAIVLCSAVIPLIVHPPSTGKQSSSMPKAAA